MCAVSDALARALQPRLPLTFALTLEGRGSRTNRA